MMRRSALAIAGNYDEKMKNLARYGILDEIVSRPGKVSMIKKPLIKRFVHKKFNFKKKKFQQLFDSQTLHKTQKTINSLRNYFQHFNFHHKSPRNTEHLFIFI